MERALAAVDFDSECVGKVPFGNLNRRLGEGWKSRGETRGTDALTRAARCLVMVALA